MYKTTPGWGLQTYLLVTLEVAIAILMPAWEMGELEPAIKSRSTDCRQTQHQGHLLHLLRALRAMESMKRDGSTALCGPLVSINVASHRGQVMVSALYLATSACTSWRGECLAARDASSLLAPEMEEKEEKL